MKKLNCTEPQFLCQFNLFANWELWFQFSMLVLIVPQYDIYIKGRVLDATSPPVLLIVIWWIFLELLWKTPRFLDYFTVTQWIMIGSQNGQQEVKVYPKLHLLHIYHIVVQSELKYLFEAKVLSSCKWDSTGCKTRPKYCTMRCGSDLEPLVIVWFGFGTTCHCAVRFLAGSRDQSGPQFRFQPGC